MCENDDNVSCVWSVTEISHDGTPKSHPKFLKKGETTIGRAVNNTVQSFSVMSSRHQCIIDLAQNGFVLLRDLGSLNGTFLGSDRIMNDRAVCLNDKDVIGIGVDPSDKSADAIFRISRKILSKEDLILHDKNCVVPVVATKNPKPPDSVIIIDDDDLDLNNESTCTNINNNHPLPSTSGISILPPIVTIETDDSESELGVLSVSKNANSTNQVVNDHKLVSESCLKNSPEKSTPEKLTDCQKIDEISNPSVSCHLNISNVEISEKDSVMYEKNLEKVPCEVLSDDEYDVTCIEEDSSFHIDVSKSAAVSKERCDESAESNCTGNSHVNHSKTNSTTTNGEKNEVIISISADILDKKVSDVLSSALTNKKIDIHIESSIDSCKDITNSHHTDHLTKTDDSSNRISEELVQQKEINTDSINCVDKPMSISDPPNINENVHEQVLSENENQLSNVSTNDVTNLVASLVNLINVLDDEENKQNHTKGSGSNINISEIAESIQNVNLRRPSVKSDCSETDTKQITEYKDNNCKTSSISGSFTIDDDDDVIYIEDVNEPSCSNLFDLKLEDNNQAGEDYCIDDDISDTDSTDEWFQRLSQSCTDTEDFKLDGEDFHDERDDINKEINSNKKPSEDDEVNQGGFTEDRSNVNKPLETIENQNNDTLKQASLSGKRKILEVLEEDEKEEYLSKENQEHYVEEELSEPLLRKCPAGSKRKLPEFSDEEEEEIDIPQKKTEDLNKPLTKINKNVSHKKLKRKQNNTACCDSNYGDKSLTTFNNKIRSSSDGSGKQDAEVGACLSEELSKSKASERSIQKTEGEDEIIKDDSLSSKLSDAKSSNYVDVNVSSCINQIPDISSKKNIVSNKKRHHNTARKSTSKVTKVGKHIKNGNDKRRKVSTESDSALCSDTEHNNTISNVNLQTKERNDCSKSNWQDYRDMLLKKIDEMEEATNKGSSLSPDLPTDVLDSGEKRPLNDAENISNDADNLEFSDKQVVRNDSIKETQKMSAVQLLESEREEIVPEVRPSSSEGVVLEKPQRCDISLPENRLDQVCKKIESSHKKNVVEIIQAKAIPVRRRSITSTEERGSLDKERASTSSDKWYSKDPGQKKSVKMSDADRKAIIKAKLSDITKKESNVNMVEERPKSVSSAKITTKVTSKSRNEIFLDTLVSNKASSKASNVDNDNGKEKSKLLSTFKIPRRNSSIDVHEQAVPVNAHTSTATQDVILQSVPATEPEVKASTSSAALEVLTDKMSNEIKNQFKRISRVQTAKIDGLAASTSGIENQEPLKIKPLPDIKPSEPKYDVSNLKSLLKIVGGGFKNDNEKEKRVHFNLSSDERNVIYVRTKFFEISEGSTLKPVTKQVTRHERPPVREEIRRASYTDYAEELIFQICNWNSLWFQERNKVKGEPILFDGQVYHLKKEFSSYSDYRRGFYPLLLHQLWQILARQHDTLGTRSKMFNFEIKHVVNNPVRFQFQNQNNQKILTALESQVLVERDAQSLLPRPGTVVVMHTKIIDSTEGQKPARKICYLSSSNVRPIASHRDVSARLKAQSPEASQVMDFVLKTKGGGRFPIDRSETSQFVVLKNLNSDLRLFQALDQLPASPLEDIIRIPRRNSAPLPPVNYKDICKPIVNLNSSQKKAVLSVANSCKLDRPIIHLIHGPPGCGKSEVITGIFQQIWFTNFHNKGKLPQILLCAPSNAAVDELVIRLDKIRQTLTNKKFTMVRIGRTDMVHRQAAIYTLERLIDVELKRGREFEDDEEFRNVELKTLQAKVNQLTYQIENPGIKKNDSAYLKNIEKKLAETIKRKKDLENSKNKKLLEGKELREKKKEIEQSILEKANVIATTLSSCVIPEMVQMYDTRKLNLTCCIVDEATQCTEPETLIPLMLGVTKLILVGDPQQLPATVFSQTAKEHGLDRSLFARHQECWNDMMGEDPSKYRIVFESRCHFLNTQYRMHPDIIQFPSEHFYKGTVLSHPGLESRKPNCPLLPYVVIDHEFPQSNQEESNIKEVHLIINIVRCIMKSRRCEGLNIGVITPYNRQRELIKKEFAAEEFSRLIEVGTVDSFQGRERDIILMSCVRTEGVGFLSGVERLNVALTRARHSLIICGNFVSLQRDLTWLALINNAKSRSAYKPYLHNSPNHDIHHRIFKSGF